MMSKNHRINTGKIGRGAYRKATFAAYELLRQYMDGFSMIILDNEPYVSMQKDYVGWLNYLFDERWKLKNRDPWAVYEKMYKLGRLSDSQYERTEWIYNLTDEIGLNGYLSVRAVHEGTAAVNVFFNTKNDNNETENLLEHIRIVIENFRNAHSKTIDRQINKLLEPLRIISEEKLTAEYWNENDEKSLKLFTILVLQISNLPVVVKVISEVYEINFWQIWETIKHIYPCIQNLTKTETESIKSVSTEDLFNISSDDLLILGLRAEKDAFSEATSDWIRTLRERYDVFSATVEIPASPIKWIHELLRFADEAYYKVYAFTGFYHETMENAYDKRYITLWKIYEEMLHDTEMLDDIENLYTPKSESGETERNICGTTHRQLIKGWFTEFDLPDNNARKTLRRYMALLSNRELRQEIFGF